ncbi:outer membrane chaperone Skp [Ruegeria sp. ANG-S4]|uniref:OmpH family outer membrane protein n=1 Tax=Ruegeria sp. ANG-S4 TaxID=1577904 RepID=UPI00057D0AFC|nr:OmpH family outer membrane protein [Ruegeria sp. ANG-S4]KIC44356.1 outer membrane chaperone Skp [Ruegeria sp. ANG-S4]
MASRIMTYMQGPLRALYIFLALGLAMPAGAQQLGVPQSTILTISSDRLFAESQFGQRVFREFEAENALLNEENERIVQALSDEERELTEKRAELDAETFRPLAEAFDEKVQSHRESQRAKLDTLARRSERARAMFIQLAEPVLIDLLRDTGASVILERSNVFLSPDALDITDTAISRINAAIGDGKDLQTEGDE